jgi:ribose transport system permease protein
MALRSWTRRLRINALLASFAMSFVASGIALWLLPAPGGAVPDSFVTFMMGGVGGVPVALIGIGLLALAWVVLMQTSFMLQLLAVGGNRDKAFSSGVPVRRVRFTSYIVSSLFTAFAALSLTFSIGSGDPLIGQSYTLLSVAAPVVGGVAILGGSGDGLGAVFGAIFLATASELLLGLGISPFYQQLTVGVIILAGLAGVVVLQRRLADLRVRNSVALRRSGAAT